LIQSDKEKNNRNRNLRSAISRNADVIVKQFLQPSASSKLNSSGNHKKPINMILLLM